MKDILEVYAKRWSVENKLAELVAFFNLNALSCEKKGTAPFYYRLVTPLEIDHI